MLAMGLSQKYVVQSVSAIYEVKEFQEYTNKVLYTP